MKSVLCAECLCEQAKQHFGKCPDCNCYADPNINDAMGWSNRPFDANRMVTP